MDGTFATIGERPEQVNARVDILPVCHVSVYMTTPGSVAVGYHRELLDLLTELRGQNQNPSLRTISRSATVSVGHLSGVFAGKVLPGPDVAVAIARALKATVAQQNRVRGYAERAAVDRSA